MKVLQSLSYLRIVLLVTTAIMISACSDFTAAVRKLTYPPDFKYVTGDELRSQMGQLAFQLQLLDQALVESNNGQSAQQQQVLDALGNIERIGSGLQAGEAGSNHPFLQDSMKNFVSIVGQAREAASMNPPQYYYAGKVAGGCINCHKINR